MTADKSVLTAARDVMQYPSKYGHSDVGDVLVDYLKNDCNVVEALERLSDLKEDYTNDFS